MLEPAPFDRFPWPACTSFPPSTSTATRATWASSPARCCGFTPQYAGLEKLWTDYRDRGFAVLGFPCDQFGHQEPDDEAGIRAFCAQNFGVSFPMFAKVEVNGEGAHPLWRWLKEEKRGFLGTGAIKWNFTKFLVGRDGHVLSRYAPTERPESLAGDIERALRGSP